jgi:hypothetical protein
LTCCHNLSHLFMHFFFVRSNNHGKIGPVTYAAARFFQLRVPGVSDSETTTLF